MPLETATYISQLNAANPAHTDALSQADSHMRLIKSVLQAQFPNFTAAALNSTNAAIDAVVAAAGATQAGLIPIGGTIMWWSNTLPNSDTTHWAWCNGATIGTTTSFAALAAACPALVSGGNVVSPNLCEVVPMGLKGMGGAASRSLVSTSTPNNANAGTLGPTTVLGELAHTMTTGDLVAHNHGITGAPGRTGLASLTGTVGFNDPGHFHTVPTGGGSALAPFAQLNNANSNSAQTSTNTTGITVNNGTLQVLDTIGITVGTLGTSNTGSGSAFNITQPTMPVNWIIRIA